MAELQEKLKQSAAKRRKELVSLDEVDDHVGRTLRRQLVRENKLAIVRAVRHGDYEDCMEEVAQRVDGPPRHLWDRKQAAAHCGCHRETISRWVADGKLRVAHWHGRRPYFEPDDVKAALRVAQQGRRMDYAAIEELTGFNWRRVSTMSERGLFPGCNRDCRYKTSEVYEWFDQWSANPDAPFDNPEQNARFLETMKYFKRLDEERVETLRRLKVEEEARRLRMLEHAKKLINEI